MGELTQRERQVLALVAKGLDNSEIGLELGIESGTVKTHVHSIYHKMSEIVGKGNRVKRVKLAMWVWQMEMGDSVVCVQS